MLRYAITDRKRFSGDEAGRQGALVEQAGRLAASCVDFLQLREKDLDAARLAALARRVLVALQAGSCDLAYRPRLLVNSRADVAVAVAADGVHLTALPGELTLAQVLSLYASAGLPPPIVSVSCHTLSEVARAREEGASMILFGPIFEKVVHEARPPRSAEAPLATGGGLDFLQKACVTGAPVPVLALGGITEENALACGDAGAAGIAAIRLFLGESGA